MPEQSPQRFITTHDASGASVFDASIPTTVPDAEYPGGLSIFKPNMQPKAFPHPSAQTPISKSTATASPTQEGSLLTTPCALLEARDLTAASSMSSMASAAAADKAGAPKKA
ncbi:hypothetical protein RJZ90_007152 [Blastomyces dermatitidis]